MGHRDVRSPGTTVMAGRLASWLCGEAGRGKEGRGAVVHRLEV